VPSRITRLVYQRGAFDAHATDLVTQAMVWWSLSLPFQGVSLLFSRTFFSLQQPWATTALSGANLAGAKMDGGRPDWGRNLDHVIPGHGPDPCEGPDPEAARRGLR